MSYVYLVTADQHIHGYWICGHCRTPVYGEGEKGDAQLSMHIDSQVNPTVQDTMCEELCAQKNFQKYYALLLTIINYYRRNLSGHILGIIINYYYLVKYLA